jgi:hypothetical protein
VPKSRTEDKRRRDRDRRNRKRAERRKRLQRRAEASTPETRPSPADTLPLRECPIREIPQGIDAERITDLADLAGHGGFLGDAGRIARGGWGVRLANHYGTIVSTVTGSPSESPQETPVRCRRRPDRKPCPGQVQAAFEPGTTYIHWFCPACHDEGWIRRWHGTPWDQGGRIGLPRIDKLIYRHGLTDDIETEAGLKEIVLEGSAVSEDIVRSIHDNGILGRSGVYGDPTVGDPLQVDHLEIGQGGSWTKITVYNRAIMLFATNDEYYVQIHRVCCAIDKR